MHSLAWMFEYLTLPFSTKSNFFLQDHIVFCSSGLTNCVKLNNIALKPYTGFPELPLKGQASWLVPWFLAVPPCSFFSPAPSPAFAPSIFLSLWQCSVLGLPKAVRSHANGCSKCTLSAEVLITRFHSEYYLAHCWNHSHSVTCQGKTEENS